MFYTLLISKIIWILYEIINISLFIGSHIFDYFLRLVIT